MSIDETGEQRAVSELDDAGRLAAKRHHVIECPGGGDRVAPDGHRCNRGLIRIHRHDVVADEDRVRGTVCVR